MKQQAVILSAAIPGIGSLGELLPEGDIADFMNEIHAVFETTLRFHHGKLKRFTGDTVLGVFYGGQTKSPAGLHALDAAFAIKEQLQALFIQKLPGQPFRLRMGIAIGNITETAIGSGEARQMAILGEAVTQAERICRFCGNEQVLTDKAIYDAAGDYYDFQKLEPIPLKGGKESLAIFEPINKKRKKLELKTTGERKIASEMVGRSREMEQMEGLFKQLLAGKGCIVNIVGKAGIGKSRLVAEMKVQPIMEKVLMLEGRALSTGQNMSYHPIIHLIKSWAGITEEASPLQSSEKLYKGIQQNRPDQPDEIYAFLATMMGLHLEGKHKERVQGIEGDALEKLILKNLRDLIIAATRDKPRIYLIEDMHWSDASSIKLFESLYKLSQHHPVMFVNVLRPGYSETGDHILKFLVDNFPGDHITVHVSPLDASDSGQLIQNLTQDIRLPESVKATIIRKTEGNPFFIEEVIRSFLDEGIIEVENNIFRITEKINKVNIPETINEVILSRIDKLDEKTKELLKTASVIGRNFYFKVLEEAADTIGELDERLQYLKEVQLIGESKKMDDIEFLFKHALAQQATYESIVLNTKKELHLKIARSIEKVFVEKINEFFGTLAMHYGKAGMSEKKLEYLIKAGDEAFKSGASNEALSHYKEALILMPAKPSSAQGRDIIRDIHINIGFAQQASGHNIEAIETIEMILQRYFGKKYPKSVRAEKLYGLWGMIVIITKVNLYAYLKHKKPSAETNLLFKLLINWGEAISTLNPSRFLLLSMHFTKDVLGYEISGSPNAISIVADFSVFFTWSGMSFTVGRKMLETAKKAGAETYPYNIIDYRYTYEMYRFHVGNWVVDQDFESVYRGALQFGRYWETTVYVLFNGFFYVELGRYDKMMEMAGKMNEISESFDNSHAKAQMYRFLAMSHFRFRKIPEALKSAEEGIAYTGKTGHHAMLLVIWCAKSLTHSIMNQPSEAQSALDEAEKYIKDRKVVSIYHGAYLTAKVYIELAELNTSVQQKSSYKKQAKTLVTSVNKLIRLSKKLRNAETEAYRLKAIAFRLLNKPAKACKYFTLSIEAGEKLNHNLELSRTWFEAGKFLSDPKTGKKKLSGLTGKDYLEKAKAFYEEMDLHWDLEEYRKCVG